MTIVDPHIEELIVRYLQEDITERDLRELVCWMDESPENKQYVFQLKNIYHTRQAGLYSGHSEIRQSWERMLSKIKVADATNDVSVSRHTETKSRWLPFFRYAAIVLVCIGIGFGLSKMETSLFSPVFKEVVYNKIVIEKGGKANKIYLSDGTKVTLNAATTFSYPADFTGDKREVFLDGEAYFEVEHNEEKPFIVQLRNQQIKVLGTSFNVNAYRENNYSVTTLLKGSITLETFDENRKHVSYLQMQPGQEVYSDNETGNISLSNVDASIANSWVHGIYKFKDEQLQTIVRSMERLYNVDIKITDDSLKVIRYTGSFLLSQDIKEVLRVINYESQFSVRIHDKDVIISRNK